MIDWIIWAIIGLIGAATALAIISIAAIYECVRNWWGSGINVLVVDPSTSAELEKIAASKGTHRHIRFIYNKSTGQRKMVESDSISDELANNKKVKLYVS